MDAPPQPQTASAPAPAQESADDFNPAKALQDMPQPEGKKRGKKGAEKITEREADKLVKKMGEKKSKEVIAKEEALRTQLVKYGSSARFGKHLDDMGFKLKGSALAKMDQDDLEEMLQRVRLSVDSKNSSKLASTLVLTGVGVVEGVTQIPTIKPKLDLSGLSQALSADEEFQDTVHQLELEYSNLSALSPEKRLMLIIASSGMKVAAINRVKNRVPEMLKEMQEKKLQAAPAALPPAAPQPQAEPGAPPVAPPVPTPPASSETTTSNQGRPEPDPRAIAMLKELTGAK